MYLWSSGLESHNAWINSCEDRDVTVAAQPSWGGDVHLARLRALRNRHFSIPQGVWGIREWISMYLCVYAHEGSYRCVHTCTNVGMYMWVYSCIYVTAALEELQQWLSFFPMDARNSGRWQCFPKQLLAEGSWEALGKCAYHSLLGILCTGDTLPAVSETGTGKLHMPLPEGGLCWHLCLAALQGGSPWEHSSHSLEPLSFSRGVRTEYLHAFLRLMSEERLCFPSSVSFKWLTSGALNWDGFVSQDLNFSTVDWPLLTQH